MFKPESIQCTLERVAQDELGLKVNAKEATLLGQYVGRFKTEHQRQDISTAYVVRALRGEIRLNTKHFTNYDLPEKSWRFCARFTSVICA